MYYTLIEEVFKCLVLYGRKSSARCISGIVAASVMIARKTTTVGERAAIAMISGGPRGSPGYDFYLRDYLPLFLNFLYIYHMDVLWIKDEDIDESLRSQIEELNRCFFPENLEEGKYILEKKQSNPIRLILSQDDHVIGHLLAVERNIDNMKMIYVGEVCVDERFQGQGYGKFLLEQFSNHFSPLDYDFSILCCEEKNEEFYSKHGWKNIDIDLYMESRKADGCVMVRNFSRIDIPSFDIGPSV